MSHLYPVFMRVVAVMFAQAGILPHNHPATRFGIAGVKKYGIGELLGEAWYNLRNRRGATPYQWGIFASIILMLGAFIGAIGNFVFSVAFGVGSVAQAQLFSNPNLLGPGGPIDSSIGRIEGSAAALPAGTPFDKRIGTDPGDGSYIYNDYALIMLDKILRSSAATPQKGGSFQNGITALFQVYNTAVTVVAAIMIFWIIVSIVVDTAKTGTIGGGRHNMVWAPIRIVFALGLMIPLGTVGYSSGQYCVMKLAEWGSNLGSNGWNAYATAVTGMQDMLVPVAPENVSGLINGMVATQVCRVAYNTHVEQSTGSATAGQVPDPAVLIHAVNSVSADRAGLQRAWTNNQDGNMCGMIVLPVGAGIAGLSGDDVSRTMTQLIANQVGSPGYASVINNARNAAINAIAVPMVATIEPWAKNFACIYVPHALAGAATPAAGLAMVSIARDSTGAGWMGGVNTWGPGYTMPGAASATAPTDFRPAAATMGAPGSLCGGLNSLAPCTAGAIPAPPALGPAKPSLACHMQMNLLVSGVGGFLANAINAAATILNNYIIGAGASAANSMLLNMRIRGWGGMGTFMNELASLNIANQSNGLPAITVIPGKLASGNAECQQGYQGGTTACKLSDIDRATALVMAQYQSWYETLSNRSMVVNAGGVSVDYTTAPPTPGGYSGAMDTRREQAEQIDKPALPGMAKMAFWCMTGQCAKAMEAVVKRIFGLDNKRDYLWTNLVGGYNDRTYPLMNMVVVGNKMVVRGGVVLAASTLVQTAVGVLPPGLGLAGSIIFDFARTLAYAMMTTGMMLSLYVPVLPTIRVSFAVLTWMVCVFEAVVMVPIACLAHLTTEGEGLAPGPARACWGMWLGVLLRPILCVFGFIGAFVIFNAWVVYFTDVFITACMQATTQSNIIVQILFSQAYAMVYVTLCYSTCNASFKLMDQMPNAMFKWLGVGSGSDPYGSDGSAQEQMNAFASKYSGMYGAGVEGGTKLAYQSASKTLGSMIPKGVKPAT
ncbi:MAG: DotA/TraY family protein [Alphaproteobacteria bacterium]